MQLPNIPENWLTLAGLGGGGYGLFRFLEFVLNWVLKRGDREKNHEKISRQDLEASLNKDRATLRQEIAELQERMDRRVNDLETTLAAKDRQLLARERDNMRLEMENRELRGRYHRQVQYVQEVVGTIELTLARLGVPPDQRPTIPRWIHEEVDGPTAAKPPRVSRGAPREPYRGDDTGTTGSA